MSFDDALAIARLGKPVRRDAWPLTRSLVFSAGQGLVRAVCVLNEGSTTAVLKASDIPAGDRDAGDWSQV